VAIIIEPSNPSKMTDDGKKQSGKNKFEEMFKKLERENATLKARANLLSSFGGDTYRTVDTEKELGPNVLVAFGKQGADTHCLVIHKRIGRDPYLTDESWVISQKRDIPQFLANQGHPGVVKINENINKIMISIGVSNSLLVGRPNGSVEYQNGTMRKTALDEAKLYKGVYKVLTGKDPHYLAFMSDGLATAELDYLHQVYQGGINAEMKALLNKKYSHQPHLMSGMTQNEVPYLYGASINEVESLFYSRATGQANDPVAVKPQDYVIFEETVPDVPTGFVWRSSKDLIDLIEGYQKANKTFNEIHAKKLGKNPDKEEQKQLKLEKHDATVAKAAAASAVRESEFKFQDEAYSKKSLSKLMFSDLGISQYLELCKPEGGVALTVASTAAGKKK
jgi:hypothetical protein